VVPALPGGRSTRIAVVMSLSPSREDRRRYARRREGPHEEARGLDGDGNARP